MKHVAFYVWKLEKNQDAIIERIHTTIEGLLREEIESEIIELASWGDVFHPDSSWGIKFGPCRGVTDPEGMTIELPPLELLAPTKENKKNKQGAYDGLKMLVAAMKAPPDEQEVEHLCAVTDEGHTVGKEGTDVQISPQELEYAHKIKDLLGGCKMRITKGNITIEVD